MRIIGYDGSQYENENLVVENYIQEPEFHKHDLIKKLRRIDHRRLAYYLQKYDYREENKSYNQGNGLCAIIVSSMNHWE